MNLIHYGAYYDGGKIYFFENKKKIAFCYKNMITIIDFKSEFINNLNFYLRSKIITFDIDKMENIILVIDSSMLLILANIHTSKIILKMILKRFTRIIKISPLGKYFVIGTSNKIELWKFLDSNQKDPSYFQIYRTFNSNYSDISNVEWNNDGNYLIALTMDKLIKIFSFRQGNNFNQVSLDVFFKKIFSIQFYFNSKKFCVLSEKNILTEWTFFGKKKKNQNKSLNDKLLKIELSRIVFLKIGKYNIVKSWFHPFSEILFLILSNGQISFFQTHKKIGISKKKSYDFLNYINHSSEHKLFKTDPFEFNYLSGSIASNLIAIGKKRKKEILIYDWLKKKVVIKHQNFAEKITSIALSPNDKIACSCNLKGQVTLWSLRSGFCFINFKNHINYINRVIFLANNSRLVLSSSYDGTVKMYDLKKCIVTKSFTSLSLHKNFDALGVDKSGSFIASACKTTFLIFIWSVKNGLNIEILKNHQLFICDLYFTQKNIKIVTGSYDKRLILWNLDDSLNNKKISTSEILQTYFKIISIVYHPFKNEIAVLFDSYCISFFKIKKRLEIIGISIDIRKTISKLFFNLKINYYISIAYSFSGKNFVIKDSNFQIISFQLSPLFSSTYYDQFYTYLNNKAFNKIKNKQGPLILSKKKNFGLFYYCEGFFLFNCQKNRNFFFNLYNKLNNKKFNNINKWKPSFKWMLILNKENFINRIFNIFPFVLIKKFLIFSLFFKSKPFYITKKNYNVYKIQNMISRNTSDYIDLVLVSLREINNNYINIKVLSKIKIFIKPIVKQLNKAKIFSFYFSIIVKLAKLK